MSNAMTISMEDQEKNLIERIKWLEDSCYHLFSDTMDLTEDSPFDTKRFLNRFKSLMTIYKMITDKYYDYLYLEVGQATKRFQLKSLVGGTASFYALFFNPLVGVASFFILQRMSNKEYTNKLKEIEDTFNVYDMDDEFDKIERILENSFRIYCGRQANKQMRSEGPVRELMMGDRMNLAKKTMDYYLDGTFSKEFILSLSENCQKLILKLYGKRGEEKTLDELLEDYRKEKEEEIEYKKKG